MKPNEIAELKYALEQAQEIQRVTELGLKAVEGAHQEAEQRIEVLEAALNRLARLGNEPHYGNSTGNCIARKALEYAGISDQQKYADESQRPRSGSVGDRQNAID